MLSSQTPDELTGRQREMLQNIKNYRPTPTPSLSLKNKLSELVANSTLPLFFWGGVWNYKKRQRKKCKKVAPGYNRQEGKRMNRRPARGKNSRLDLGFCWGLGWQNWGRVKIVTQNKQFHQFGKSMAQRLRTWALESGCLGPWALFCLQLCNLGQVIIWLWHLGLGSCAMEQHYLWTLWISCKSSVRS